VSCSWSVMIKRTSSLRLILLLFLRLIHAECTLLCSVQACWPGAPPGKPRKHTQPHCAQNPTHQ
jgi:hypothetical protein